jgi:hypothetical protein
MARARKCMILMAFNKFQNHSAKVICIFPVALIKLTTPAPPGNLAMRRRLFALLIVVPLTLSSAPQVAVEITTSTSTVRQIFRYTDELPAFAPSLVIEINDPLNISACRGGWLNSTDAQYRDVLQLVLTAKAAGLRIRLNGDTTRLFPGSSDPYCYINFIGVQ